MNELREQRRKLVEDQRQIVTRADTESRAMTVEEMSTFDKLDDDINNLKQTIDRAESVAASTRADDQDDVLDHHD